MTKMDEKTRKAILSRTKKEIKEALGSLTVREAKVLKMRYGMEDEDEHTLEKVGQQFKVTKERIRQIEKKALEKLLNTKTFTGSVIFKPEYRVHFEVFAKDKKQAEEIIKKELPDLTHANIRKPYLEHPTGEIDIEISTPPRPWMKSKAKRITNYGHSIKLLNIRKIKR